MLIKTKVKILTKEFYDSFCCCCCCWSDRWLHVARASRHQIAYWSPSVDCARLFREFLITHKYRKAENTEFCSTLNENHDTTIQLFRITIKIVCDTLFDVPNRHQNGAEFIWFWLNTLFLLLMFHQQNGYNMLHCFRNKLLLYDLNWIIFKTSERRRRRFL